MPEGGYAPKIRGVEPRYIYEAMLTGPQNMPNFSNGNLPPDEKRDVIAYLRVARGDARVRRLRHGRRRPGQRGHVRLDRRHRRRASASPSGSRPTPPARRRTRSRHERQPRRPPGRGDPRSTADPIANPGLPAHVWRPTDVDPKAEKRAERQVALAVRPVGRLHGPVRRRLLRPRHRRGPRHRPRARRVHGRARALPGRRPAVHRHRRHPVGAQADVRPRDHRVPPPRRLLRRRTGEETLAALSAGLEESGHRPPAAGPQLAPRRGRPCSACRPSSCCATSARPQPGPTAASRHRLEARSGPAGMRVARDVRRHPDPGPATWRSAT